MTTWRWLDFSLDGDHAAHNMELDQAIVESVLQHEAVDTIRVYRWPRRIVTYGRLQNVDDVARLFPEDLLIVRPTGGKAVVHGDDLTVTIAAHGASIKSLASEKGILSTYNLITSAVTDTIAEFGVCARSGKEIEPVKSADCFLSVGKCDLIDENTRTKVVGCAQLRHQGAILQQMSLRPHSRYHIDSNEFLNRLRNNFSKRLLIDRWDLTNTMTVREISSAGLSQIDLARSR